MADQDDDEFNLSPDTNPVLPSPEQIARLAKVTEALWVEMESAAAAACDGLVDMPELGALRARLMMLQAGLGTLRGAFAEYVESRQRFPNDREDEAFRWIGALEQAIEHWMDGICSDVEDYQPYLEADGETPEVGFGGGFQPAWQRFKAAYADWSTASSLMDNLDQPYADCTSDGSGIERLERHLTERAKPAGA